MSYLDGEHRRKGLKGFLKNEKLLGKNIPFEIYGGAMHNAKTVSDLRGFTVAIATKGQTIDDVPLCDYYISITKGSNGDILFEINGKAFTDIQKQQLVSIITERSNSYTQAFMSKALLLDGPPKAENDNFMLDENNIEHILRYWAAAVAVHTEMRGNVAYIEEQTLQDSNVYALAA